jgi:terminase small subunit-like protein
LLPDVQWIKEYFNMSTANVLRKTSWKKRAFLAAFSRCGSLSQAAKRAGVDRRTHYNWLKSDPHYAEAFEQAKLEAADALEDKLNDLAHEGNVTAAIFLLKGLRPEKYRDRSAMTVEWDGDVTKLTDAQLDRLEEQGRAAIAAEQARKRIAASTSDPAGEQTIDVTPVADE